MPTGVREDERRIPPEYLTPRGCYVGTRDEERLQRYALRMETAEPVSSQIKQGRGFRLFLLRDLEKVNREWSPTCTGHNLLNLLRYGAGLVGEGLGGKSPPETLVWQRIHNPAR